MDLFLLRNLPDEVRKEDLENAFAEFGSVEYVKIKPPTPSGRLAIIKMAKVGGGTTYKIRECDGHEHKERRLRIVKPRFKEERGESEQPVSKEKKVNPLARAIEHFLRFLRILKPLPEKVRVKR